MPGVPLLSRGKVRDIYDLGDHLLLIATDRISAFDHVLPQPIPDKGKVLHQISMFWFEKMRELVPHHVVTDDVDEYPEPLRGWREVLEGRSALVRKADMFPVECVARGYIVGSGWKDYQRTGAICGIPLPDGLRLCDRLPEPIFTPATKAETGHDENIDFDTMADLVGRDTAERLRDLTLDLYARAAAYAEERGIIIADTKFEFGVIDGRITICDEMLTPDSSRFWPRDEYEPGRPQPSFDKQYVRDYLERIGWDKETAPPDLPAEVVEGTRRRYLEALERLTGHGLR
ncbi:MAG: phosphoribosylaminoimidazolesuccinocarboxamide synthase [Acidobacteria bacterium]|nr:MAG: phosphoribosylaminoimidazolesuccinocarboxamide synthase [Acidobacteriota bacterium]